MTDDSDSDHRDAVSPQCLFDNTGDVDSIDYAKPLGRNNMAMISRELLCPTGDDDDVREMQRNLMYATLTKNPIAAASETEILAKHGHARNFIAVIGMLWNGRVTKQIQDRPFDVEFDQLLLDALLYITNIPRTLLDPTRMLTTAIAVNDPLLLTTAIDMGADVNDISLIVSPLHNAKARRHEELVTILLEHGAKE